MAVTNIFFLIQILFASIIEYFGDASFKLYTTTNSTKYLISGILFYIILILTLIQILSYANVMQMNIQWDALSVIIETALAYFLLKETLSGVTQYVGFIFIILGLIIMSFSDKSYS